MLVDGAWEPSAGPPTGLGGLNACSVSCAKATTYSNPLQEPPRPGPLCKCIRRWHAQRRSRKSPEAHNKLQLRVQPFVRRGL